MAKPEIANNVAATVFFITASVLRSLTTCNEVEYPKNQTENQMQKIKSTI
jgi:hypothetical protein